MSKRPSIADIASKRDGATTLQRENLPDDLARFLEPEKPASAAVTEPAPIAPESVAEVPAPEAVQVESGNATTQSRRNVTASKRSSVKTKREGVLPHDSIYLHEEVRRALKVHAAESGLRLQEVLRLAVQQYLSRQGIKFRNLETGERENAKAS